MRSFLLSLFNRISNPGYADKSQAPRQRPRHYRTMVFEHYEERRLLAAEGSVVTVDANFDAAGLIGPLRADYQWGDDTTSAGTISGGVQAGRLQIEFDYSLDDSKFFGTATNDPRRVLLQGAADALISRFADDLDAVVPPEIITIKPSIFHPSKGPADSIAGNLTALADNPSVPANVIVIYAGARNLPGSVRGAGATGAINFSTPVKTFTCVIQADCDRQKADYEALVELEKQAARSRGESGVLATPVTDFAPTFASLSFDNADTNWFFGTDPSQIAGNEIDFVSIATHELAHALGFGTAPSWTGMISGGQFQGANATRVYGGPVPAEGGHWGAGLRATEPSAMRGQIPGDERSLFSELDFAAMDDLGWDLIDSSATVQSTHRYPDDGTYRVNVLITDRLGSQITVAADQVPITNVAPTLTAIGNQTVLAGQEFSQIDIGTVTDPGFQNSAASSPTFETFDYTIDWGDGTIDTGVAAIDTHGNANGALTTATFDGSHVFATPGNKTVTLSVRDDNNGAAQSTFVISVLEPPSLSLTLDRTTIHEESGATAATLTVKRSGPPTGNDQSISLASDDTSEAILPASIVIPGTATEATVSVQAVDDALLDGDQTIQLSASAPGLSSDTIDLLVEDRESLIATVSANRIVEDAPGSVTLQIRRSNTDIAQPLEITITGGDASEIDLAAAMTLDSETQQLAVAIAPVNDDDHEPTQSFNYVIAAVGYQSAEFRINLIDDEPPFFQNPQLRHDVNNRDGVTASDALTIINALAARGEDIRLDPNSEQADGVFLDVSGDYLVTALDALQVINELAVIAANNESVAMPQDIEPELVASFFSLDEELRRRGQLF